MSFVLYSKSTCFVEWPVKMENLENCQEIVLGLTISEIPPNPPFLKGGRGDFWQGRGPRGNPGYWLGTGQLRRSFKKCLNTHFSNKIKFWLKILFAGMLVVIIGGFPAIAQAKPAGYCLECHSSKSFPDSSLSGMTSDRSVYLAKLDPCPGLRSASEEMYFTGTRMVKINEILRTLRQEGWSTETLERKAGQTGEAFSRLERGGVQSTRELARESSALRSALQKIYDQTVQARAESDHRWLIGIGILCFIALLVLLGVGFHKLARMGKMGLLLLLVGGNLSLAACSSGPSEPAKKSPAQESLDQSLAVADQAAGKIEEGFYLSILTARLAREWSQVDPGAAEKAFHLAWQMALAYRQDGEKLRSFERAISRYPDRSAAVKQKVNYDTVLDLRDELRNADSRTWALRAVAEEWARADAKNGQQALEDASRKVEEIKDPEMRDRDLKSLAEAWAPLDENRAWVISGSMADPFLKSLTLARLALSARNRDKAGNFLREAWETARSIPSPYPQAQALIRISAAAGRVLPQDKKFWAEQTMTHVQKLKNPKLREAALQEMILLWASVDGEMAERWAGELEPEQAEARAYAFLQLSLRPGIPREKARTLLVRALEEAKRIPDAYESGKIMSRVGKEFVKVDPPSALFVLQQIQDSFYRSEILSRMAESLSRKDPPKAMDLAGKIPLETMRAAAMVEIIGRGAREDRRKMLSLYQETFQAAQAIPDPYTRALILIELGKEWGGMEKGREIGPLEMALKTTEAIPNLSARAEVLEMLAAAWKPFQPDTVPVIMSRIDPSVTGVQKTMAEIRLWAKTDPAKAGKWAESIPDSFPYEKAVALREVAANWKKSQPKAALGLLEKALGQGSSLPEGVRKNRVAAELGAEAASVDKEWTLRWISQVPDPALRDLLCQGAGNFWAGEDPAYVLKAAGEISESSLRLPLYRKAAESAAKKALLSFLSSWAVGREKAKREGLEAVPFYEEALQGIEKVSDSKERAYLLSGLAADWTAVDEKKALQIVEKIPADEFPEPHSYALLQIAGQYGKWSRKEAESLFPRTLSAAEKIGDPSLRAQRMLQIARQWKPVNSRKGMEVLKKALAEARKGSGPAQEPIILAILQTQAGWEPEKSASIGKSAGSASMQARILLEGSKVLRTRLIDEKTAILEKALLLSRKEKNERLVGEVAAAWFALVPRKGLEILGQMESRDLRVQTLRRMAQGNGSLPREETRRLLDQAADEAARMEGTKEKIQLLKEVASDMTPIDKERARATYLKAYQIAEKEFLTKPTF
jgi:hypothetical protein